MCHDTGVEVRGQLSGVCSLLPPCGSGDGTQIFRIACSHAYALSHLAGPPFSFWNIMVSCGRYKWENLITMPACRGSSLLCLKCHQIFYFLGKENYFWEQLLTVRETPTEWPKRECRKPKAYSKDAESRWSHLSLVNPSLEWLILFHHSSFPFPLLMKDTSLGYYPC